MVMTNVELYEALKDRVGVDTARLIAEVVPTAAELATKRDLDNGLAGLRLEIVSVREDLSLQIAGVREEIQKSSKETMRWMLTFFIPVWAGTWGMVLAVLLKH